MFCERTQSLAVCLCYGCWSFSETVQLLEENQHYLSQLTSLLQDTTQETGNSVMVQY